VPNEEITSDTRCWPEWDIFRWILWLKPESDLHVGRNLNRLGTFRSHTNDIPHHLMKYPMLELASSQPAPRATPNKAD